MPLTSAAEPREPKSSSAHLPEICLVRGVEEGRGGSRRAHARSCAPLLNDGAAAGAAACRWSQPRGYLGGGEGLAVVVGHPAGTWGRKRKEGRRRRRGGCGARVGLLRRGVMQGRSKRCRLCLLEGADVGLVEDLLLHNRSRRQCRRGGRQREPAAVCLAPALFEPARRWTACAAPRVRCRRPPPGTPAAPADLQRLVLLLGNHKILVAAGREVMRNEQEPTETASPASAPGRASPLPTEPAVPLHTERTCRRQSPQPGLRGEGHEREGRGQYSGRGRGQAPRRCGHAAGTAAARS